ncbi:PqiB family protein [Klebsiella michiganensis]|uniref:PqiB family protein n=1 Tax=Klebsiella michiganensis TaxID=1134687 RepID=UPI001626DE5D|nr:MlaD family protein [Klebsiella michiganensis]QNE50925.1 MCE family protein [Klebsiella michiganensis]
MQETARDPQTNPIQSGEGIKAELRQRRFRWPSGIWFLPIVAVLVGASLVLHNWLNTGPLITIRFNSAEGLSVGKTQVQYKEVIIGIVENIELGPRGEFVLVKARINKNAAYLANQESRFWVVRPRFGIAGPSGLGTLLSGAYIGVDAGKTQDRPRTEFVGLEVPPAVTNDRQGKRFIIYSSTLGSLDIGSPVYFRHIMVGRVASYQLQQDGQRVALEVFIDAPNDRLVTKNTRFWNASGVDLSLNAEGLKLNTQSLATLVAGGIAFDKVQEVGNNEVAQADSSFQLYPAQDAAYDDIGGATFPVRMEFTQSVRGLSVNAPIEFQGIPLGKIKRINLRYDRKQRRFLSVVEGEIQPKRLDLDSDQTGTVSQLAANSTAVTTAQPQYTKMKNNELSAELQRPLFLRQLVADGLRAQLETASYLTGQMYVSLSLVPKAPKATLDISSLPLMLPTTQGGLDQMEERVSNILGSLEQVPFGDIGKEIRTSLRSVNKLLNSVNTQLTPEARKTLQEAQRVLQSANTTLQGFGNSTGEQLPLVQNANQTLQEINRAARSVRILTDYLQTHPETLIRGRDDGSEENTSQTKLPVPTIPASND